MIAVDTNMLVYAHREDSPWHATAYTRISELAEGSAPWAIPWPCLHEFLSTVTNPNVFKMPTPLELAFLQLDAWLSSPKLALLGETDGYLERLRGIASSGRIVGPLIHDARIATLCLLHGIDELWTADRDFGRFPQLRVRNPLIT